LSAREAFAVVRLRPELPHPPRRIARLPLDKRGYPTPWFAARINGEPDFRIYDQAKFSRALKERRCWVCGDKLGAFNYFVLSPYCTVTRTSTEPPCHEECAEFSARACPFLTRPEMRRRDALLPEQAYEAAGEVLEQSPGVVLVWATLTSQAVPTPKGVVCKLGDPMSVRWYKEGRPATRQDVQAAVSQTFPELGYGAREAESVLLLYDKTA
jgi:hypothetical protein